MRNLLPVCAGLLLISGIVSAKLWQDLHAERELTASLRKQLTEATGLARAPAMPAPMPVMPGSAPAPTVASTPAASTAEVKPVSPLPAAAQTFNAAASIQNSINQERELWKDPEYRKARLAQTRANLKRQNADLAEVLGLTEKDADRIIDVLAEYQITMNSEVNLLSMNAQNDPAAQQDMMRRQTEMLRQRDDSLSAVLGPKLSQYQQYQQAAPARSRVTSMNNTLAQAGQPLNATQIKSLTATMAAEQQRQQQDMQALTRNINVQDPEARTRVTEELRKRNEETNRRVLEAAAPTLTAQQLATLRAEFETQDAVNRASSRVRERTQALGGVQ